MADETTTTDTTATTTDTTAKVADTTAATTTTTDSTKAADTTATTEAKATDSKADDGKTTETKTTAEPVDYAKALAEVKLPEGMTLDPEATKAGTELFAKHKLSADAVKDLVGMYAAQQKAGADASAKAFSDQVTKWRGEAEKATTPEERGDAKTAALAVFGKDEVSLLEHFGVTNRAGFIKAMAKVSKAIKDDAFVPGNAAVNGGRDARSHFPNSNMNP